VWDGQNIVAEVGATGVIVARYLRGANLIAREQDGAAQYYLFNAHGDVAQRTDALGNLLKNYRYDAFGNEENPEPLDVNPFRYCGEYYDRETGDYYLRARSYDPRTGRMLSEDPVSARKTNIFDPNGDYQEVKLTGGVYRNSTEEQFIIEDTLSYNLYLYCENNPVRFKDPTGCVVDKKTPPTEKDGYVAPKGGAREGKTKSGERGWVDKNGNVWVPRPDGTPDAHGGGHWDVNRPDGKGYVNKYPGGHERPGTGKVPSLPKIPVPAQSTLDPNIWGGIIVLGLMLLFILLLWWLMSSMVILLAI